MKNRIAFLELATVRSAYERDEYQAMGWIKKLYYRGVQIVLLSSEQRATELQTWLAVKELDQYTCVYQEDLVKNRFFFFFLKRTPSNWKHYFLRSLTEDMEAGRYPGVDLILFTDRDEPTRQLVSALNDPRIIVCASLEDAAKCVDLPPEALVTPEK